MSIPEGICDDLCPGNILWSAAWPLKMCVFVLGSIAPCLCRYHIKVFDAAPGSMHVKHCLIDGNASRRSYRRGGDQVLKTQSITGGVEKIAQSYM
ncbi:hypothetical protein ES703_71769 [subsurface metagenome]